VHDVTLQGDSRTNIYLAHNIGHKRPSVWRLIKALQTDNAEAASRVARHAVGTLSPKKQSKAVRRYQRRMQMLCQEYEAAQRTLAQFLHAVGHSMRLA